MNSKPRPALAIVVKGYPRLSETFIAQEILNIERSGINVRLYSLRHPTDKATHPVHDEIQAAVNYLPEYLYQEPVRVVQSWWRVRKLAGYSAARRQFLKDLKRDFTPNRIRRFGQALVMAAELNPDVTALYVHFLHTPASVTRYTAKIRNLPWACSAHAKDIYTSPDWEIREKLADCQWLTTCTRSNTEHLRKRSPDDNKVWLNYHGLDLDRFAGSESSYSGRDGSDPEEPVRILSVGRAVTKKGYSGLLHALANLPTDLHWIFHHIGGGELCDSLKQQTRSLSIADKIHWSGAQPQQYVLEAYRDTDLFVLNSCIDQNGDRDGLPNVLIEAQSQGIAVIGTTISGIPELIEDQHNGLLVEPKDQAGLSQALQTMIENPGLRQTLGIRGRQRVENDFEMGASFARLHTLLSDLVGHRYKL